MEQRMPIDSTKTQEKESRCGWGWLIEALVLTSLLYVHVCDVAWNCHRGMLLENVDVSVLCGY